jgi:hypothetical protein
VLDVGVSNLSHLSTACQRARVRDRIPEDFGFRFHGRTNVRLGSSLSLTVLIRPLLSFDWIWMFFLAFLLDEGVIFCSYILHEGSSIGLFKKFFFCLPFYFGWPHSLSLW